MASNDDAAEPEPSTTDKAFAVVERMIHAPALPNAQTPIRVVALLVLTICVSLAPLPANVVGVVAVVVLALSLGHNQQKGNR